MTLRISRIREQGKSRVEFMITCNVRFLIRVNLKIYGLSNVQG